MAKARCFIVKKFRNSSGEKVKRIASRTMTWAQAVGRCKEAKSRGKYCKVVCLRKRGGKSR